MIQSHRWYLILWLSYETGGRKEQHPNNTSFCQRLLTTNNLFSHITSHPPSPSEWWSHMLHSINCPRCSLWSLTWIWNPTKTGPPGLLTISRHFVVERTRKMCAPCESPVQQAAHVWSLIWTTQRKCWPVSVGTMLHFRLHLIAETEVLTLSSHFDS